MKDQTIRELASHFSAELSFLLNWRHGTRYPDHLDEFTATSRLRLLQDRIGDRNFRHVVTRWEQELIPGIDVEFTDEQRAEYLNKREQWRSNP